MVAMVWCVILLGFTIFHGSVNGAPTIVDVVAARKRSFGSLQWRHLCRGVLVHHGDASAVITLPSAFDKSNQKIAIEIPGEKLGEKPVFVRSVHENKDIRVFVLTRRVYNAGLSLQPEKISSDEFSRIKDGADKLYIGSLSIVSEGKYEYYVYSKKTVSLSDCNPKTVDANQPDPSNNQYVCVKGDFTCKSGCPLYVDNGSEKILLGMYFLQKELPSGHGYVFLNMLHHRKQIEDWIEESEADELQKQNAAKVIQKSWSDHFYGTFKRRNARVLPRASSI